MSAPQPDPRSVDDDPTGMRALLRGLPDPGPMPDELVARIQASLATESRPEQSPVVDLAHYRSQRAAGKGPWIAAAAAVLAVGGGGLLLSGGGPGSLIAAFGDGGSAASVASGPVQTAQRDSAGSDPGPSVGASGASVRLVMSNAAWSGQDLTSAAAHTLDSVDREAGQLDSPSTAVGALSTEDAGRDCADALGVPADAAVVIDLGTHDGQPAALVVATTTQGARTAYLVGRNCRTGNSELRIGPQALRT